jgi:hypothetical protein
MNIHKTKTSSSRKETGAIVMTLLLRWALLSKSYAWTTPLRTGSTRTLRPSPSTCTALHSRAFPAQMELGRRHRAGSSTRDYCSRRAASTSAEALSSLDHEDDDTDAVDNLVRPESLFQGTIPYPVSPSPSSPSSILEFQKCPQSFLFQYLYKLRQPTSTALAKGKRLHLWHSHC